MSPRYRTNRRLTNKGSWEKSDAFALFSRSSPDGKQIAYDWIAGADKGMDLRGIDARRQEHGFLLTAWVFLSDHWHAIFGVRYPKTLSLVLESIKVASTRRINRRRQQAGILWQGRFFDRALRTVKEGNGGAHSSQPCAARLGRETRTMEVVERA
jgi:hypothetical protein